jgi:hypothetical protein
MNGDLDRGNCTQAPSLAELIQDPLIGLLMASDGVDRCTVERLFEQISRRRSHATSEVPSA